MKLRATTFNTMVFAVAAPTVVKPMQNRISPPVLRQTKGSFRLRTQSVLVYLVETLRKTW